MDDLVFSPHARREMARDGISEDEVYHVMVDHDEMIEQDNGRTRYGRMMEDGRYLVAVVDHAIRTIWTVWWDSRASRRRRR